MTLTRPPAPSPATDPLLPDGRPRWIWSDLSDPSPHNRFTWFRRVVHLERVPDDPTVVFAADSTAKLWVNGVVVRRKVARFDQPRIRAEVVDLTGLLRPGPNVVVALHHSWGDIVTFQRTAAVHAGLWLSGEWLATDEQWRWLGGEEFAATEQFRGVHDHTPRIRYPIDWDTRLSPAGLHDADHDDADWLPVVAVDHGPWPERPSPVETPGQREVVTSAGGVLAAGTARHGRWSGGPTDRPSLLAAARLTRDPDLTRSAGALVDARPWALGPDAPAGATAYVTLDFHRPVHGYPLLDVELDSGTAELRIGYGELVHSLRDGSIHAREDGWIDVDGVVATGYADRVVIGPGRTTVELPDERTARWLTLHVTRTDAARLVVHRAAMVTSQYPVRPTGSFSCGHDRLEQAVRLCLIHAEVTMTDTYVDTPGREDGAWIEDARPRAQLAERWYGDVALRRFLIRTLADGQDETGELHPFYPSNYPARPATYDWALQWVGMLHDDWRWTADADFVAEHLATLIAFWGAVLRHLDDDAVWRTAQVAADIRSSRVPTAAGSSGPITPWVMERLADSAELARAVGRDDLAEGWQVLVRRMQESFRRHHLVDDVPGAPLLVADRWEPGATGSYERGRSQAGQAVALLGGLLSDAEAAALIEYAFPAPDASPPAGMSRWNTPTWSSRVLQALTDHGHGERAVAHLLERFAPYLPAHPRNRTPLALQGPYGGPLPEYWLSREDLGIADGEINPSQPVDPTGTHGWGAVPLLWLHECLLGVRIATPGGAELTVRPDAAGLPYVAGWTLTPRGPVHVHLDPQQRLLEVSLPPAVTARVRVPAGICEGGTLIGPDGRPVTGASGRPDAAGDVVLDRPGRWVFAVSG